MTFDQTLHTTIHSPRGRLGAELRSAVALFVLFCVGCAWPAAAQQSSDLVLAPTNHPPLPSDPVAVLAGARSVDSIGPSAKARGAERSSRRGQARGRLATSRRRCRSSRSPPFAQGPLGHYARVLPGLAELRLGRPADARQTFQALRGEHPAGYLVEAAALREAECDEALGDQSAAIEVYERLSNTKTTAPDEVLMRLGRAAQRRGRSRQGGRGVLARVVYEFPFSDLVGARAAASSRALPVPPIAAGIAPVSRWSWDAPNGCSARKRYAQARPVFEALRGAARGDDRELVQLRLGECDYFLKRARNARDEVQAVHRQGVASGRSAVLLRGRHARSRRPPTNTSASSAASSTEFPTQSWAEEALNNLATYYILQSDDESAEKTFREMYEKFPDRPLRRTRRVEDRLVGLQERQLRRDGARVRIGGGAISALGLSPAVAVLVGARARSAARPPLAEARYALVATDYLQHLLRPPRASSVSTPRGRRSPTRRANGSAVQNQARGTPNRRRCRPTSTWSARCSASSSYDQALDELHYAQKVWGDSSAIQATIGWIFNRARRSARRRSTR